MAKIKFTTKQIEELSNNPVVKYISSSQIDFTFEFKEHIILECKTFEQGVSYFERNGVGLGVIGFKRIEQSYYRWKRQFREQGNVPFILERKRRPLVPLSQTDSFKKLSLTEQNTILLQELAQERKDNYLLKKYMPSLDGSKVKKN